MSKRSRRSKFKPSGVAQFPSETTRTRRQTARTERGIQQQAEALEKQAHSIRRDAHRVKARTTDVGRPLTDIKTRIDLPNLDKLITEVIDTLQTRELEMKCSAGHWWSVRIRPYKTTDSKIDGAVLAFVDIDHQKAAHGH